MSHPKKRGICKGCGGPVQRKPSYSGSYFTLYCSTSCRRKAMGIVSFPGFDPCPVEGCQGTIRVSSLATCKTCWARLEEDNDPLRIELSRAWHFLIAAGVSEREEAKAAYEQLKSLAIVAAEGRLARESETEQKRARRRDLVRHRTSKRQVAA